MSGLQNFETYESLCSGTGRKFSEMDNHNEERWVHAFPSDMRLLCYDHGLQRLSSQDDRYKYLIFNGMFWNTHWPTGSWWNLKSRTIDLSFSFCKVTLRNAGSSSWRPMFILEKLEDIGTDLRSEPCPILFTAFSFSLVNFPSPSTASSSKKYRLNKSVKDRIMSRRIYVHLITWVEEVVIPDMILIAGGEFGLSYGQMKHIWRVIGIRTNGWSSRLKSFKSCFERESKAFVSASSRKPGTTRYLEAMISNRYW